MNSTTSPQTIYIVLFKLVPSCFRLFKYFNNNNSNNNNNINNNNNSGIKVA